MKCPICKKSTYKHYEGLLGYEAMRCSNCGFESSARNEEQFKDDVKKAKLMLGKTKGKTKKKPYISKGKVKIIDVYDDTVRL